MGRVAAPGPGRKVPRVDLEKLQELMRIFEESQLSEIEIEEEGRRVCLRKPAPTPAILTAAGPLMTAPALASAAMVAMPAEPVPSADRSSGNGALPDDTVSIDAPMVGTFYAAPAPGKPTFVREGETVAMDQTVCIIEAMKLMNEVTAKFPAAIVKVLVENGEPVEFGQPLFIVRPLEQPEFHV